MPPKCGQRDSLGRECGMLKGHFNADTGSYGDHEYLDTPESLRRRNGAAASDRAVIERTEDEALLDEVHRVAMIDRLAASAECRFCHCVRHDDACFLYRQQLEKRLLRVDRLRREQREQLAQTASRETSLEQAVADLEANQNHGSEQLRTANELIDHLHAEIERLRESREQVNRTAQLKHAEIARLVHELNVAREESATVRATLLEHVEDVVLVEELLRRVKEDQR